jgi:hypothetical protein
MRSLIEVLSICFVVACVSALFVGAGVTAAGFYAGFEISE